MLKAVKDNKVYKIVESDKARYLADGFDIYEDGKLAEKSSKATVPYADYKKLQDENELLKSKIKGEKKPAAKKSGSEKADGTENGGE